MKKSILTSLCLTVMLLGGHTLYGMQKETTIRNEMSISDIIANQKTTTTKKIRAITHHIYEGKSLKGQSLLIHAIKNWNDPKLIQFLLDNGVHPNEKCPKGHHSIMYALERNITETINLLLNHPNFKFDVLDHDVLGFLTLIKKNSLSTFLNHYCEQINPEHFLKNALLNYAHKPNMQICSNIHTWVTTCYKKCAPKTIYEKAYFLIDLQKHFYSACSKIIIQNNNETINNLKDIQDQFTNFTMPILQSLLLKLQETKPCSNDEIKKLFIEMNKLQTIIHRTHPEMDIFKKYYSNSISLFQSSFETKNKISSEELKILSELMFKSKNNQILKTFVCSYIQRITKETSTTFLNDVLDALRRIILQDTSSAQYADILYEIFARCPEKYADFYKKVITKKTLTPNELALTFHLISKKLPFEIEEIQNKQLNYGIRASILSQLQNIPSSKRVGATLGIDCAQNILAYTGCNFTIGKNAQPFNPGKKYESK